MRDQPALTLGELEVLVEEYDRRRDHAHQSRMFARALHAMAHGPGITYGVHCVRHTSADCPTLWDLWERCGPGTANPEPANPHSRQCKLCERLHG